MKRIHMLLALLMLLSGGAGALYSQGYWDDTWADQQDELAVELYAQMEEVPEPARKVFADCLAKLGVDVATANECPLDTAKPLVEQVEQCAQEVGAGQVLAFGTLQCILEAQATLEGLASPEQEAP